MARHFSSAAQSLALAGKDLAHALRRKAERDESWPDIGDLSIFDDLTVPQFHDRNAFKADAPPLRFRKSGDVAKGVARVERMAVRKRFVHVPAKVARRAIEPVVDQFRDFSAPGEGAIEGVVIDAIFGKQTRKIRAVATFDGVTESAKQSGCVHANLVRPYARAPPFWTRAAKQFLIKGSPSLTEDTGQARSGRASHPATAGERPHDCSRATRRGASRPISPSRRSCREAFAYIEREYNDVKGRVEFQRHVVAQLHMVAADTGEAEAALDALSDDEASKLRILDYSETG